MLLLKAYTAKQNAKITSSPFLLVVGFALLLRSIVFGKFCGVN